MSLSKEQQQIISAEESILAKIVVSLRKQFADGAHRLNVENERARSLTAAIVGAARDVDKQLLASDEAVSHQLASAKHSEVKTLDKIIDRPYFARIVLEEQEDDGRKREIEYKLGTAANPDCRIIDWRKAPIAKLYYEYQEDEEYCEMIQGRERNGTIKVRNKLHIVEGILKRLSCKLGNFISNDEGNWTSLSDGFGSRPSGTYGELPSILSLITADQFRMITEDAKSAIFIQGIAGSGKTTVAMHRLAWLLHEDNSDTKAEDSVVIVMSRPLQNYISGTLPAMDVHGVRVLNYHEWAQECFNHFFKPYPKLLAASQSDPRRTPPSISRVKRSGALLRLLNESVQLDSSENPATQLISALKQSSKLLSYDETKLLDLSLINEAREWTEENFSRGIFDSTDQAIFLRICQLRNGKLFRKNGDLDFYGHIVADEIQDYSPIELETILFSVKESSQLTLVGDTAQEVRKGAYFWGWEALRNHRVFDETAAVFTSLTVSHRSTLPIMRFADHVLGHARTTEGRAGRAPLWFKCKTENEGVRQALGWIERVQDRFPGSLLTVLCRSDNEAAHVQSLLEPTFGSAVRLGDEYSFSFEEGILVTSIRQAKGLEFPHVLIWNPNSRAYRPSNRNRNLLYVAITRAEEHLCLITWGKHSKLLPSPYSKLCRLHELEVDDDD